jgi:hypothetical protein
VVERVRISGMETMHSFSLAVSVPPASPLRVSSPVSWVKLPSIGPISKSTVTSASTGSSMNVEKSGTSRRPSVMEPLAESIWA